MATKNPDDFINKSFADQYQEGMLITALLYAPEMVPEIAKIFPDDPKADFIQYYHNRSIYKSILELYKDGTSIDEMTLRLHMVRQGRKSDLDKSNLSLKFEAMTPSDPDQIKASAEGILSLYRRQSTHKLVLKLYADLEKGEVTDEDIAGSIMRAHQVMTSQGGKSAEKSSAVAARGAAKEIERAIALHRAGKISGVTTGIPKLDRETGGWQKDEVIVLGGRPGMLKTGFALFSMYQAASQSVPCGFFSMEMNAERLNFRLASMQTAIPYKDMIRGKLSDEEFTKTQTALSGIEKLPIWYYDDVSIQNVEKMNMVATEWCRDYGIKAGYIDYLQYLQTLDLKASTREAQVSQCSKAVKSMNRKLEIPLIELVQLSRETEKRADPTPQLSDLRESGQIEADASTVIGLLNPGYYIKDGKPMQDPQTGGEYPLRSYYLNILKARSGGTPRVEIFADPATNRFAESDNFSGISGFQQEIFEEKAVVPLNNAVFNSVKTSFDVLPPERDDDDDDDEPPF